MVSVAAAESAVGMENERCVQGEQVRTVEQTGESALYHK